MRFFFRIVFVPLCAVFILSAALRAQDWTVGNRLMIHAGAGLPLGSFGQTYNVAADFDAAISQLQSGISLSTAPSERTEIGNATLGFNVGLTDLYKITPNISLLGTLELSYNPFNASDYISQYNSLFRDPAFLRRLGLMPSISGVNVDVNLAIPARAYLNTALLLGGRYDIPLNSALSLYASAQAGVMYGIYPEYTANVNATLTVNATSSVPISGKQTSEQSQTIRAMNTVSFAYKFAVGALVNDSINIGVAYFAAQPQYGPALVTISTKTTSMVTVGTMTTTTTPVNSNMTRDISTRINVPVGLLQLTVGYLIGQ